MVLLGRFGGVEGFSVVEQPMPVVGPDEVRVRVLAASVQFTDVIIRKGKYPGLGQKPPLVLGYDVVGEIGEIGANVSTFAVGDRVADLTVTGSYARYRTLRADRVVRVPPSVDAAEAAALVLSWTTAYQLLHRVARVAPGHRILVYGASGAVGQALLTLGRLAGLQMWGTCHASQAELVRSLGATPIDAATQDAHLLVPAGFDAVFDGIGARGFADAWACVSKGGVLAAFGFSAAVNSDAPGWKLGWWLLRLHVWNWSPNGKRAHFYSVVPMRKQHPAWYRADLEQLFALLAADAIHPRIAKRIALDAVADAHRQLEAGGLTGKIILCP
ncbi:MAG: medium chain dehydrogenase/reductase family protein [Kofleriaceae bacterium]